MEKYWLSRSAFAVVALTLVLMTSPDAIASKEKFVRDKPHVNVGDEQAEVLKDNDEENEKGKKHKKGKKKGAKKDAKKRAKEVAAKRGKDDKDVADKTNKSDAARARKPDQAGN